MLKQTIMPVLLAALFAIPAAVPAVAGTEMEREAGYVARAVLPSNQIDGSAGYFDLQMRPGQEQELVVQVENLWEKAITVTVEAVSAATNRGGMIDYSGATVDNGIPHPFAGLARVREETLEIPPGATTDAVVAVTMPEEELEGLILGSIRILKLPEEQELEENGIVNQFSYAIAVRLRGKDWVGDPAFALGEIDSRLVNHKAAVVVPVANLQPVIIEGAQVTARISGSGGVVIEGAQSDIAMAPGSAFPMTLVDRQGYGFSSGEYRAEVVVRYQDRVWNFEEPFRITEEKADAVNGQAVNQYQQAAGQPDSGSRGLWWIIIAVPLGAAASFFLTRAAGRKKRGAA